MGYRLSFIGIKQRFMTARHILTLVAVVPLVTCAQKEAYFWHFGDYAGIDFNSGAPVAITNSALSSIEGTSSFSDGATGNLLFYTDGITVYDRNSNAMPNGTGLQGNSSSTQCGLIVRLPGTTNIYYVFSVDQLAGSNGLKYSIVDMSLNGGLGDVTSKNVPILSPTCEKVTAVRHCNGVDYWILTHEWNSNAIYAYPLTASGLGVPVVTNIGMVVGGSTSNARGELKLSPDGTKLAAAYDWLGGELYDFDNSTGIVSNVVTLATGVQRYGVCFSPDNSKLYMTDGWQGAQIFQYDINAGNIPGSAVIVGSTAAVYIGSLQNGPDGKIYVATYGLTTLGRINNPNALGVSCNYVDAAFNLIKTVRWGLPNFPADVNIAPGLQPDSISMCQGSTVVLQAGSGSNYQWSTGDTTQTTTVSVAGTYTVSWISNSCSLSDTFIVEVVPTPNVSASATDSTLCAGDSTVLTASGASSYVWTPGGSGASITVTPATTQTYKVVGSNGGCADSAEITITVNPLPIIDPVDVDACEGIPISLHATGGLSYVWQPGGDTGVTIIVTPTATTMFTVTPTDVNGCANPYTFTMTVWNQPQLTVSPDQSICIGDSVLIEVSGALAYTWYPGGSISDSLVVSPTITSTYTVVGTEPPGYCADTAFVAVSINPDCPPAIYLPNAFSPNADGKNDLFGIVHSENFTLDRFEIFNRWGEVIFETNDLSAAWDGRKKGIEQPVGAYTYMVTGQYNNEPLVLSGNLTLLR